MKRTKLPDILPDGRVLGAKTEDSVPEHLRHVIPKNKTPDELRPKTHRHIHAINMACRTRMPLAATPDGDISFESKKLRLKGLNQAKFNALIAGLKSGMRIGEAAKLVGISQSTIQNWTRRGNAGEKNYVLITQALREAEAEAEKELLEAIRQAGTVRLEYEESIEERVVDEHGNESRKTIVKTKTKFPQFQAAAWILERTRPEVYRSDREIEGVDMVDIAQEIEAMKQISDVKGGEGNGQ